LEEAAKRIKELEDRELERLREIQIQIEKAKKIQEELDIQKRAEEERKKREIAEKREERIEKIEDKLLENQTSSVQDQSATVGQTRPRSDSKKSVRFILTEEQEKVTAEKIKQEEKEEQKRLQMLEDLNQRKKKREDEQRKREEERKKIESLEARRLEEELRIMELQRQEKLVQERIRREEEEALRERERQEKIERERQEKLEEERIREENKIIQELEIKKKEEEKALKNAARQEKLKKEMEEKERIYKMEEIRLKNELKAKEEERKILEQLEGEKQKQEQEKIKQRELEKNRIKELKLKEEELKRLTEEQRVIEEEEEEKRRELEELEKKRKKQEQIKLEREAEEAKLQALKDLELKRELEVEKERKENASITAVINQEVQISSESDPKKEEEKKRREIERKKKREEQARRRKEEEDQIARLTQARLQKIKLTAQASMEFGDDSSQEPKPVVDSDIRISRSDIGSDSEDIPNAHLILEGLYLGSCGAAGYKEKMKKHGITHILTVAGGFDPLHPKDFNYKLVKIEDKTTEDLMFYFPECIEFIENALAAGGKILVHCIAGKSRSVSVVLAYMMKCRSFNLEDALNHIMERRKVVIKEDINFLGQLELFQEFKCKLEITQHHNANYIKYKDFSLLKKMDTIFIAWQDGNLIEDMLATCAAEEKLRICCEKCQYALFTQKNIVHYDDCQYYFIEPMSWMMESIKATKSADLMCPSCLRRIGYFSWVNSINSKCSCFVSVQPTFRIFTNKVSYVV